jgi:phosphoribosylformylglycinamidine cyclo-ligase
VFTELQRIGDVGTEEMRKVFNLGVGMVAVVPERRAAKAIDELRSHGQRAWVIGEVVAGSGQVRFSD